MPEITQKAPVAVIEILQPETQPDFESLHELVSSSAVVPQPESREALLPPTGSIVAVTVAVSTRSHAPPCNLQAAFALKDVTITKATVIEPMPELASSFRRDANGDPGDARPEQPVSPEITFGRDMPTGVAELPHSQEGAHAAEPGGAHAHVAPYADAPGGGVVRPGGEDRMKMVFDDREAAENSDEHLKHVAEQCAPPPRMQCTHSVSPRKRSARGSALSWIAAHVLRRTSSAPQQHSSASTHCPKHPALLNWIAQSIQCY